MGFWRKTPDPDSVRIGRIHDVPAEVHYSSGSDRWWYHGPICLTETRSLREEQFSPHLQDPRNGAIVQDLQSYPNAVDEDVAKKWTVPVRVVKEIRVELERRAEPHVLRVYTLKNATKRDERVLGTIDQDLFAEAPSVPYLSDGEGRPSSQVGDARDHADPRQRVPVRDVLRPSNGRLVVRDAR